MKISRNTSIVLVLMVVMATALYAADVTVGTWKLNLTKSRYSPANLAPKSQTLMVTAVSGGGNKFVVDVVDADGKKIHYEYTTQNDGKDATITGDPNRDTTAVTRIDDSTYNAVNKKGGKVTTTSKTVFSKDGKTRTITTTGTNPQGQKVDNTTVWDKQ